MTKRRSPWPRLGWALTALALAGMTLAALAVPSAARTADSPLQLVFVYGSEKQKWLEDVTKAYRDTNPTVNGRPVVVELVPMGSGETVDAVLNGEEVSKEVTEQVNGASVKTHVKVGKPDLISPASEAYLILGNAQAVAKGDKPIVPDDHKNLVLSPVVIAMWKPMAEALGWPTKPIGWKTLRDLAANKDGWKSVGHEEWGAFKFGHTNPEKSNSGLLALLEEVYAAAGKKQGLAVKDVEAGAAFLTDLERSVVHYHTSTGFFADTMFKNGPDYFSAAVMYENLVIDSYPTGDPEKDKNKPRLPYPVVAIYPEEGTFMSDHPVALVQRDWVTKDPDKQKAADDYIAFLLKDEQQKKALKYGFRPAVDAVAVDKPIDADHGVDPAKPGPGGLLRAPDAEVMQAALNSWKQHKKHARVIIVFDDSGSMGWQKGKLENAKAGAKEIVKGLKDEDSVGLLIFDNSLDWADKGTKLKDGRDELTKKVDGIEAGGQTALYDAIAAAYDQLQDARDPDAISAVILLTDGVDYMIDPRTNKPVGSKISLDDLLKKVKVDSKKDLTLIYTIAYGSEDKEHGGADPEILKKISDATKAKSFKSTKDDIKDVIKAIVAFF